MKQSEYLFTTERLGFRLLRPEDIDYFADLNGDPDVRAFFPDFIHNRQQSKERMDELIGYYENNGLPCFLMFLVESDEFVGRCGFGLIETGEIEVGYLLHKKFWQQGYATEALTELLLWAKKNIDADYIIAFAPTDHIASQKVMQKSGMEFYKNDIGHGLQCCFYRINNRR
jgi:ribosomal-protein-alanine N-acetyltransferase